MSVASDSLMSPVTDTALSVGTDTQLSAGITCPGTLNMALLLTAGDLITTRIFYAVIGVPERAVNVLHHRVVSVDAAPTTTREALAKIADKMLEQWALRWKGFASENVGILNVSCTNVFPLPRSVTVYSTNALPTIGEVESECLPMQDAVTLLKQTDNGARWGMGRVFVPGIPESQTSAGTLTLDGTASVNDMVTWLKSNVTVTGDGWNAILEPVLLGGPEDNPIRVTKINGSRLSDATIKTQRRRRPGKGS